MSMKKQCTAFGGRRHKCRYLNRRDAGPTPLRGCTHLSVMQKSGLIPRPLGRSCDSKREYPVVCCGVALHYRGYRRLWSVDHPAACIRKHALSRFWQGLPRHLKTISCFQVRLLYQKPQRDLMGIRVYLQVEKVRNATFS